MKPGYLLERDKLGFSVVRRVLVIKIIVKLDICHNFSFSLFHEVLLHSIAKKHRTGQVIAFLGRKNSFGTWVRHKLHKT